MDNFKRARELESVITADRRVIHGLAEVGFETEKTAQYVREQLKAMGYEPQEIFRNSVVATVGNGGKTMLLRADMDALPMEEMTGLDFASVNGNMHACGHDVHTAMLLGAARILKKTKPSSKGP